jgi:hypothetical protein
MPRDLLFPVAFEIATAEVASRENSVFVDSARERSLVEGHARYRADVVFQTRREQIHFRPLVENIVDNLHTVNQPSLYNPDAGIGLVMRRFRTLSSMQATM